MHDEDMTINLIGTIKTPVIEGFQFFGPIEAMGVLGVSQALYRDRNLELVKFVWRVLRS